MNCVYVVTCKEHQKNNLYKIGYTKNLQSRLKYYKTAFPSKAVTIHVRHIHCHKLAEKVIHFCLRQYKYQGQGGTEWFRSKNIVDVINIVNEVCNFLEHPLQRRRKSVCEQICSWAW